MSEITASQSIPERYLEQILTNLRRSGIVQSQRGSKGGYILAREPWQITLLEIVLSVEGDNDSKGREYFSKGSTLEKDLVRGIWQQVREAAQAVLSQQTLQDLHQQRQARLQGSSMYYI